VACELNGGYLASTYDKLSSCSNDPYQVCVKDASCDGGTCDHRVRYTPDKVDMNILTDQLVKHMTRDMWQATSAGKGLDNPKTTTLDSRGWSDATGGVVPTGSLAEYEGCDKPTYFISHNWGGSFFNFVESINTFYANNMDTFGNAPPEGAFVWVCTFANNQHNVKKDMGRPGEHETSAFAKALDNAKAKGGGLLSVQDDSYPQTFTLFRAWCVFEFAWAKAHDMSVEFACKAAKCKPDLCSFLSSFSTEGHCLAGVFYPGMVATRPQDKTDILEYMAKTGPGEPGGVEAVTTWIQEKGDYDSGVCSKPTLKKSNQATFDSWSDDKFYADLLVYPHYLAAVMWEDPPIPTGHALGPRDTPLDELLEQPAPMVGLCDGVQNGPPK